MQHTLIAERRIAVRSPRRAGKSFQAVAVACAISFIPGLAPPVASAGPHVEFDVAPVAECRDVTPPQRIAQYPNQRLVEVALSVSVRFRGMSMDDVDELAIEVSGAPSGMRVHDFAPATQMFSEISKEIETTTTTTKKRSFDGTLGGTIPVPGAETVAHLSPSITAGLSGCDTETEKINRLPPKHAVVVSGTSSEGRGVFFKLKRYSQTSLEGVHDLSVTFVAPRAWHGTAIQVDCAARGQQPKILWMRQTGTVGHSARMVQLVEVSVQPVRQTVLKPAADNPAAAKTEPTSEKTTVSVASGWRPPLVKEPIVDTDPLTEHESTSKSKKGVGPLSDVKTND
jgi:hypothetical protein